MAASTSRSSRPMLLGFFRWSPSPLLPTRPPSLSPTLQHLVVLFFQSAALVEPVSRVASRPLSHYLGMAGRAAGCAPAEADATMRHLLWNTPCVPESQMTREHLMLTLRLTHPTSSSKDHPLFHSLNPLSHTFQSPPLAGVNCLLTHLIIPLHHQLFSCPHFSPSILNLGVVVGAQSLNMLTLPPNHSSYSGSEQQQIARLRL